MADTEHTIRLRAVLDDSDVQAKLKQLKSGQTQNGGSQQSGQNINSLLQRLNMTLQNLQRSIDRLASQQGRMFGGPQGGVVRGGGGVTAGGVPVALTQGGKLSGPANNTPILRLPPPPISKLRFLPNTQTAKLLKNNKEGWVTPAAFNTLTPEQQAQYRADSRFGLRTRPGTPKGSFDAWSPAGW